MFLASRGEHRFLAGEPRFRDAREEPIRFVGCSISVKRGLDGRWHPSVRIHPDDYRELRALNRARTTAGLELVPRTALRLSRTGVRPFAPEEARKVAA